MLFTFGTSRERGLKRVPRDGPPTWAVLAMAAVKYKLTTHQDDGLGSVGAGAIGLVSVWNLEGHCCYGMCVASEMFPTRGSWAHKLFPLEIARCPSLQPHFTYQPALPQAKAVRAQPRRA